MTSVIRGVPAACLAALLCLGGCGTEDPAVAMRHGDYATSLPAYAERAAAGDVDAQNILGVHYYLGLGVPRDFARAAALFEQAALANHADAQRNLAIMYMNGYGVPQDNQRAYGWFFQSHSGGNLRARSYIKYLADNVTPNAGQKARLWVEEQIRAHLQGGAARAGDTPGS
ncbi:MAG: sel1 repeat family protein [Gammaproteobacteria bacterium]|nr:sel1 repeat family protein [Gammaproteobacteria bacterium]